MPPDEDAVTAHGGWSGVFPNTLASVALLDATVEWHHRKVRLGIFHRQHILAHQADVRTSKLNDMLPGWGSHDRIGWMVEAEAAFWDRIEFGTLEPPAPVDGCSRAQYRRDPVRPPLPCLQAGRP